MSQITLTGESRSVNAIESFLASCEKTQGAYFWHSSNTASGRRSQEQKLSDSLDLTVNLPFRGMPITFQIKADLSIDMSCHHVYRHVHTKINGINTTITVLKSLIQILQGLKPMSLPFVRKYCPAIVNQLPIRSKKMTMVKAEMPIAL